MSSSYRLLVPCFSHHSRLPRSSLKGIGMTREELKLNLGTIARSGSKNFVQELKDTAEDAKEGSPPAGALEGIIGQFGVGFYSAFMVGDTVSVHTRSARDGSRSVWSSDGSGEFTVREADPVGEGEEEMPRGCKIVVKLRDGCEEYASQVSETRVTPPRVLRWRGVDSRRFFFFR